jgi:hypothetical protein
MAQGGLKQRVIHEFGEFLKIFLFLAPLFCAFATYRMWLLHQFGEKDFAYGAAFVNAFVLAKIILIGQYLRLRKRQECKPLIYPTIYKSFEFALLAAFFHVLEEVVKGFLHGKGMVEAFAVLSGRTIVEVLVRSFVMFCAFLPFFALRETERVLGEDKLANLFLRPRASAECDLPGLR